MKLFKPNVKSKKATGQKVVSGRWPVAGVLLGALFFLSTVHRTLTTVQAQSGGDFTITKSVISNGGGVTTEAGNVFAVTGVIGQNAAGTQATRQPFTVTSGFFVGNVVPTAAAVTVSGRVLDQFGLPVSRARVTMSGSAGVTHTALTNSFGYFRFDNVPVGETYIIEVRHKRYVFVPRVVSVSDEITDLDILGTEN